MYCGYVTGVDLDQHSRELAVWDALPTGNSDYEFQVKTTNSVILNILMDRISKTLSAEGFACVCFGSRTSCRRYRYVYGVTTTHESVNYP